MLEIYMDGRNTTPMAVMSDVDLYNTRARCSCRPTARRARSPFPPRSASNVELDVDPDIDLAILSLLQDM